MPALEKGDRVELKSALEVPGRTFAKGTRGTVTHNSAKTVASVRVKFTGDSRLLKFRVVLKKKVNKL